MGFVWELLHLSIVVPIICVKGYKWKGGNASLSFLAILLGYTLSTTAGVWSLNPLYQRVMRIQEDPIFPETRLPQMMAGGVFFENHRHLLDMLARCVCSARTLDHPDDWMRFLWSLDSWEYLTASSFILPRHIRSWPHLLWQETPLCVLLWQPLFALFETQVFRNIGTQCAGALIGGNSVLLLPSPCIFYYIWGKTSHQVEICIQPRRIIR